MFGTASQQQLFAGQRIEFARYPGWALEQGVLLELPGLCLTLATVAAAGPGGRAEKISVPLDACSPAGTAAALAAGSSADPYAADEAAARDYARRRNAAQRGERLPNPELAGDPVYLETVAWCRQRYGKKAAR